jgi:hypothetical protein
VTLLSELTRGAFWSSYGILAHFHSLWSEEALSTKPLYMLKGNMAQTKVKPKSKFL